MNTRKELGLACKAKLIEEDLRAVGSPSAGTAAEIGSIAKEALSQTRALARGLDPIEVQSSGITPALQTLAAQTEELYRVHCASSCCRLLSPLSPAAGLSLFHIAQEAVRNAIEHGHASRLDIELSVTSGVLRLRIRDNGTGFDPETRAGKGLGLQIMGYRAATFGAKLAVNSAVGQGTVVEVTVPHPEAASEAPEAAGQLVLATV